MITVILNCYKRPEYLQEQINAIRNQTIKPEDIWIWYNNPEDSQQYDITDLDCKVATLNHNFKFHGRFAFGLLAQTEYVAFFDDDTIPGTKWFENCMNTMKEKPGILGTSGVLLRTPDQYQPCEKVGWNGILSEHTLEVDLVGHAWFLKRDWLKYLWYEYPISWENGEDIQLSYLAQKHGNIKTYVPPHPGDMNMWGSTKGAQYGNDNQASFKKTSHDGVRNDIVKTAVSNGWKTVNG
jgi:glycosyltransferase involved in cell wall biosynthesis